MKYPHLFSGLLLSGALFSVAGVQAGGLEEYLGHPPGQPLHSEDYTVNSQFYLPPPPQEGSAAFENDKAAYLRGYALKGSPRWQQASTDADLHITNVAKMFSPLLGVTLDPTRTPATWKMLDDLLVAGAEDAGNAAKKYYMRTRPFVVFKHHTCQTLQDEDALRINGSYPSGHTAFGTLTVLVLSQARPDLAQELAKRGYEYGQSRVICGAHWQSDVDAGRYVGAVEFARLQTVPAYQQLLQQVAAELKPAVAH